MEDNKEKGKEIALTGKYAVVRAFKKILKDPIAGEVMKMKDKQLSSDFTKPEWLPYRINLCYGEDELVELQPLLNDSSPLTYYIEALEQKEKQWLHPKVYIIDDEATARMKADELNAQNKETRYTDFQRDFIYKWIADYTLANPEKLLDFIDKDYITAEAYTCGDSFMFGIKRSADLDNITQDDIRFIRLVDKDPMSSEIDYDAVITTPEETDDHMLGIYVSHFNIIVPDYYNEDDHMHGMLCKWTYPWHRLTQEDYPVKEGLYFIKTTGGAPGIAFYAGHGWFDIMTSAWGSDNDKILLWMEIPDDYKMARDYNGKEIPQSAAKDFYNKKR